MNSLHVAKPECANAGMSGEEYLARTYCEPKAYWHCLHKLEPSDAGRHYTFDELNYPQHWLKAVAKYTQQAPSAAARQLHRCVEAARAEFRAKQATIYGERTLYAISRSQTAICAKEDAAWNTFNAQKQAYLTEYLRALKSGIVRRTRSQKCQMCYAAPVLGRTQYCEICRKRRNRESYRISKAKKRALKSKSCLSHCA